MNKKTLNAGSINKKLPDNFVGVLSAIFVLAFGGSSLANNEDYTAYAKEQAQKTKLLIAPYQAQVNEIIKNVEKRQAQPDIQAFKNEIISTAKTQCSYQQQSAVTTPPQPSAATPILIFVSFSMPKESIKSWIAQAKRVGAAVYIRGLVNNSFKDTAKAVRELLQEQPGGLLIDPTLFKKYAIIQAPAVVVTGSAAFDVIYGDVTLDYALERITQISKQRYLSDAIKKLRDNTQAS